MNLPSIERSHTADPCQPTAANPARVTLSVAVSGDFELGQTLHRLEAMSLIRVDVERPRQGAVHITMADTHIGYESRTIVVDVCRSEDRLRSALAHGAAAVIDPGIGWSHLHAVILAVDHNLAVLPVQQAPHMATRLQTPPVAAQLTPIQRRLLNMVSEGLTIGDISAQIGCSERHARRQFRQIWDLLGAKGRVSGIIRAVRCGMLEEPIHGGVVESDMATDDTSDEQVRVRLGEITEELIGVADDDFATKFRLQSEQDHLRELARSVPYDRFAHRTDEALIEEARSLGAKINGLRSNTVSRATMASADGNSMSSDAYPGGSLASLNAAVVAAGGGAEISERLALVMQELEQRGIDIGSHRSDPKHGG